ncbi:MAG: hypothetical protein LBQ13_04755 [Endomicrobium sp.]|jgi:hypothetical protein|nr:hypothetical protein [Endomicrobium sp.]
MTDVRILDYSTVEAAYKSIVLDHKEMIGLCTGLALMFAIFVLIKEVQRQAAERGSRDIDIVAIVSLAKSYIHVIAMILALPWVMVGVEEIFSIVEKSYIGQLGGSPNNEILKTYEKELEAFLNDDVGVDFNIFSFDSWIRVFTTGLDFVTIMIVTPFVIMIDNWSFGFALVYRFIFLAILKMTGGIAFACYIYEGTRHIFYTYIKNLAICYLLIPAFLLVTVFVNALRDLFIDTSYVQTGILIMCVFLKIAGYAWSQRLLHQSI